MIVKRPFAIVTSVALLLSWACLPTAVPVPPAKVQTGQGGTCGNIHGAFVETGRILTPRALHTATLLNDGTVLIAGGITGQPSTALDSSEIFDPSTGTFLSSGTMTVPRQQAVSVRLPDGRVLIAGGFSKGIGQLPLYLADVLNVRSDLALVTIEIYDPKTKSFTPVGSMDQAPDSATLLDSGEVLLVGQTTATLFDPDKATFMPTGGPTMRRYHPAAVKLRDGRVLFACEGANEEDRRSAEVYDRQSGRFTRTGEMPQIFGWCHATLLTSGQVLVTGYSGDSPGQADLYDPQSGRFTSVGNFPFRVADPMPSLLHDGRVLVTSIGFPLYPIRKDGLTAHMYDPTSKTFESLGAIPPDRIKYTSTTLTDGSVLLAGGGADHSPFYAETSLLYCP